MKKTYFLAVNAILIALIFILGFTPLGLIPLGFIDLTILHIPVIIGTIVLGLPSGLILGLSFGTVSFLNLLRAGAGLAPTLFAASPLAAIVMVFVPRLLVPTFTYLVYKAIARGREKYVPAVPFAALVGSLTNTVFFLGFMYLGYLFSGLDLNALAENLGVAGLGFLGILLAIATGGGGGEAVAAALISAPVAAAVWKVKRKGKA
jgi:uncharacterized membrane protein